MLFDVKANFLEVDFCEKQIAKVRQVRSAEYSTPISTYDLRPQEGTCALCELLRSVT